MAKLTPQEYAEKWGRRLKGSTADIQAGIQRVTEAPGVKAAQQKELMKQKLLEAIENGTWERQVAAVSLDEWKQKALEKGVGRIAAGVDGAMHKQVNMAERLLKNIDEVKSIVDRTPRGDLETNINRMVTQAREMSKRKLK